MRSRKLSNVLNGHRMGEQNLLSRAPPCFGRYVKPLVPLYLQSLAPAPVSRTVDVRQAAGCKTMAESLSQHDEIHVVPTLLSVGKG
jgi:hypothetical protein